MVGKKWLQDVERSANMVLHNEAPGQPHVKIQLQLKINIMQLISNSIVESRWGLADSSSCRPIKRGTCLEPISSLPFQDVLHSCNRLPSREVELYRELSTENRIHANE